MKYDRIWNFNAGPAALPLEVLEKVHEKWFNYEGAGMAVMEMSHRSKEFDEIHNSTIAKVKQLMGLGDEHHVLFLQGGASTQFAMIPMNFLTKDKVADYVDTGTWSTKAIKEAKLFGNVNVPFTGKDINFSKLPNLAELDYTENAEYVHLTSNNTIKGTQYFDFADPHGKPLVCDMSSDILSHTMDFAKFGMIYAGAQKNLGPSGVTLAILRDDFYQKANTEGVPSMLAYSTHVTKNSLYNTPPTFAIYLMGEVLQWILDLGGLEAMEARNMKKADTLYGFFDANSDYFKSPIDPGSRSIMNVVWRLPSEELEAKMIKEAREAGFNGLKGHRSVGGLRASMYNATPPEAIDELVVFMKNFMDNNG